MATSKISNYCILDEIECTAPTWDKTGAMTQEWQINFPTAFSEIPKFIIVSVRDAWGVNSLLTEVRAINKGYFTLRITAIDSATKGNYGINGLKVYVYK